MIIINYIYFLFVAISNVYCDSANFVIQLKEGNFSDYVNEGRNTLVDFYAPWCGHCQQLEPEFNKAAEKLKEKSIPVVLGKVDSTSEYGLASKYGISGYPTIIFFRRGKREQYKGGRTADAIVDWIISATSEPIKKITNDNDIEKGYKASFILKSWIEDDEIKRFEVLADSNRNDGLFYAYESGKSGEHIVIAKKRHDDDAVCTNCNKKELEDFIEVHSVSLYAPVSQDNYMHYDPNKRDVAWFCANKESFDKTEKMVAELAKKWKGKYAFAWIDTDVYKPYVEQKLGVSSLPAFLVQSKDGRYIFEETEKFLHDIEEWEKWLHDAHNGNVKKSIISEPVPSENNAPVKVIVGHTFEELVLNSNKDVLLEVYATWCGHCKKFEPIYTEFAEQVKDMENLVVAKMDGDKNEAPASSFTWEGFPTIFYLKAGEKIPTKYDGERSVNALVEFVKKNASKLPPPSAEPSRDEL